MRRAESGRAYCGGRVKRGFDVAASLLGFGLLGPVLALVASAVLFTAGRPILFRQERVGRYGRIFRIVKFRTMSNRDAAGGLAITARGDARVT